MTDVDLSPEQRRHRRQVVASKAAIAAARARAALPVDRPEVFVLRDSQRFRWEIRRFGGVVVVSGTELFRSVAEARLAGDATLSAMVMPVR